MAVEVVLVLLLDDEPPAIDTRAGTGGTEATGCALALIIVAWFALPAAFDVRTMFEVGVDCGTKRRAWVLVRHLILPLLKLKSIDYIKH